MWWFFKSACFSIFDLKSYDIHVYTINVFHIIFLVWWVLYVSKHTQLLLEALNGMGIPSLTNKKNLYNLFLFFSWWFCRSQGHHILGPGGFLLYLRVWLQLELWPDWTVNFLSFFQFVSNLPATIIFRTWDLAESKVVSCLHCKEQWAGSILSPRCRVAPPGAKPQLWSGLPWWDPLCYLAEGYSFGWQCHQDKAKFIAIACL